MRKITSFLLFFSLLGNFLPVSVFAEELASDDFLENLSPELAEEKGLILDPSPSSSENTLEEENAVEDPMEDQESTDPEIEPITNSLSSEDPVLPPQNINPDAVKSLTAFSGKEKVQEFTGDMGYEYSFFLPPGGNGMTPSLSLEYSSSRKEISSPVGYGWQLPVPKIERFSKTGVENIYTASNFTSPFAGGDGELSEESVDTNGHGKYVPKVISGQYRHEFLSDNSWKITDSEGTEYFFGATENERIQNEDGSRTFSWFLTIVKDSNGNTIRYEYKKNQGNLFLVRILYGDENNPHEVHFEPYFSHPLPTFDVFPSYSKGFPVVEKVAPISHIEIFSPFSSQKIIYNFSYYDQSGDYDFQMTHYLKGIQKKGSMNGGEISESPVIFSYNQYGGENSTTLLHPHAILGDIPEENLLWDMLEWKRVPRWIYGDYNGDGWTDLIKDVVHMERANGSSFFIPEEEAYLNKGDGGWEHFVQKNPDNHYWAQMAWSSNWSEYFAYPSFLDLNGDGIPHLCKKETKGDTRNVTWCAEEGHSFGSWKYDGAFVDVNGDGLSDLLNILKRGRDLGSDSVILNTGNDFGGTDNRWIINAHSSYHVYSGTKGVPYLDRGSITGDINGDGLDDFVFFYRTTASRDKCKAVEVEYRKVLLSSADGWHDITGEISIPVPILDKPLTYDCGEDEYREGVSAVLDDINRDGLADLVVEERGRAYINNGKGWSSDPINTVSISPVRYEQRTSDFNKDGILERTITSKSRFDSIESSFFEKDSKEMPILSNIQVPTGGSIDVEYTPASAYKNPDGSAANFDLPIPRLTVSALTLKSGFGKENKTQYSYSEGKLFHPRVPGGVREQQFLGFGKVEKMLFDGSKILTEYAQGELENFFSIKGLIKSEKVFEKNGEVLTEKRNTISIVERVPKKSFEVLLEKSVSFFFDPQDSSKKKATAISFDYDSFGNPIHSIDFGEVRTTDDTGNFEDIGNDRIDTLTNYALNETAHILSLPQEIIRKDQSENILGHQKILYDSLPLGEVAKGNPTEQKTLVSREGQWISQKTEYNDLGQPTKIINPRGFTTEIEYDSESLFPTKVRNAKGHTTLLEYHPLFGVPQKITNANGAVQKITLDALGRPTLLEKTHPATGALVSAERYIYDEAHFPMSIFRQKELGHGNISIDTREYFDGFGRPLQSFVEAEGEMDGQKKFAVTSTISDELGRVRKSIFPKFVG